MCHLTSINDASACALVGISVACCAGFSVTGVAKEGGLMSKGGMKAGQGIILTKPLGTGTIMAAAMRRKAKGRWISGIPWLPSECSFKQSCIYQLYSGAARLLDTLHLSQPVTAVTASLVTSSVLLIVFEFDSFPHSTCAPPHSLVCRPSL